MNPTTKNVLVGAAVQLTAKSASALGYYANGKKTVPGWWDAVPGIGPIVPPIDDWVLDLGLPAGLYLGGKLMERRKPNTAITLKEMAFGAALTGIGTFLHAMVDRVGSTMVLTIPSGLRVLPLTPTTPSTTARPSIQKGTYR